MSSENEWKVPRAALNPGVTDLCIRFAIWASRLERPPTREEIAEAFPESPVVFALWALEQNRLPTMEQIRDRYGVSRATAYRMRADFARALATLARSPEEMPAESVPG